MKDFEKVLRDAKELSQFVGEGEIPNNLFNNMAQITNLMEIIKSFRNAGSVPEADPPAPTHMPSNTAPNNVRALMAMAPYMGESNRKNIILASKLMELMHFINSFENEETSEISQPIDNRNMLLAARPYIEPDKRDMVDLLITVMDISEVLKKIDTARQSI
ncbi:MAG: hypothetical protein FWE24_01835 [Defluviitaleaceae bacterium]|nr:hypothetical protein [Defluviitaleaceae bacterium]